MKTAALYARVSTKHQNGQAQIKALVEYVSRRQLESFGLYIDIGVSGSKVRRPELDRLMRDARLKLFDFVIVTRFDRFARSTRHLVEALEEFQVLGIDFVSLGESIDTSTPIGKLVFTVLGAVAELERDIIRERVQMGIARARAKGTKFGRPKRIVDRDKVLRLREEGCTLEEIAQACSISRRTARRLAGMGKSPSQTFAHSDSFQTELQPLSAVGKNI